VPTTDPIFAAIEALQGSRPWGRVLDAGTGSHSLAWVAGLPSERWTAVTLAESVAAPLRAELGPRLRAQDRVLAGDWRDEALLAGETFDTVCADYLLGAVEGGAPFFQEALFARLRRHVAAEGRLFAVGLEPYPERAVCAWSGALLEIVRLRDAAILLCGERPFREHPRAWVRERLGATGFVVEAERAFPIRYGERFVRGQLKIVHQKLARIPDQALARELERAARDLESRGLELLRRGQACAWGEDWLVAARPA
jgi:hypothetical protein